MIFEHLYDLFSSLFEEVIVVSNDPPAYLKWDIQIVSDIFPYRSSLTGLHAGLFAIQTPMAFVSACDTPFLKKDLVEAILSQIDRRSQIVVPKTPDGFFEPLCAVYAKTCLRPVEALLTTKNLKISNLFRKVKTKTIAPETLQLKDPKLISFFNLNTPEDVKQAQNIQF